MDAAKRKRLVAAGWRVGSTREFLNLTRDEAALIEIKLSFRDRVKKERTRLGITQAELAARLGSSQSRIAKMEAADPSVSLDLLVRALIALGGAPKQIESALAPRKRDTAA